MKKTTFDRYLAEQLKDPAFAARFERAGEAWDRRIAKTLHARVRIVSEPEKKTTGTHVAETTTRYRARRS